MRRKTRTMPGEDDQVQQADEQQERAGDDRADEPGRAVQARAVARDRPLRPRTPTHTRTPSAKTIVECPSEKKNPTLSGRCPSLMSLRVVLSIAAM